jgi:hypothetical protein
MRLKALLVACAGKNSPKIKMKTSILAVDKAMFIILNVLLNLSLPG